MGKRELLLIVVFVTLGVVLYEVTAPPGTEGRSRFNFGQLIQSAKREIQGNRAQSERKTETTEPLGPDIDELRLEDVPTVTLVGEDRDDLSLELTVVSTGFDEAEAGQLAEATVPRIDSSGRVVTVSIDYPQGGRQTASLVVRVPARMRARLRRVRSESRVSGLAAVDLETTRGELTIERVAGAVEGDHVGGELVITDVGRVSLTARSVDLRLAGIGGDTKLDLNGGTLRAERLAGSLEITGRSVEIDVDGVGGTARVDTRGGEVTLGGIRQEVRFDGRSTDLTLALAAPAAVTAIASGGSIVFTAPPRGGFTLDAIANADAVRLSGVDVPVTTEGEGEGQRATGDVAGGGPTVALRATVGSIDVRRAPASR
jgi:hypothetical protein